MGVHKLSGAVVAIKNFKKADVRNEVEAKAIEREIRILKQSDRRWRRPPSWWHSWSLPALTVSTVGPGLFSALQRRQPASGRASSGSRAASKSSAKSAEFHAFNTQATRRVKNGAAPL